MKRAQKAKFEKAGWAIGSESDLLGLNEAEAALVEAKLSLGDAVRTVRRRRHMTQAGLAKLMGSSQSRVAKVENRDPEVSMDLQLKAIFAAEPTALADFQGLIRKWSGRKAGAKALSDVGARVRR
jgi:DNA-binding XRE family transcriptional regulator